MAFRLAIFQKLFRLLVCGKTTDQNSVVGMNGPFMERQIDLLWRTFFGVMITAFIGKILSRGCIKLHSCMQQLPNRLNWHFVGRKNYRLWRGLEPCKSHNVEWGTVGSAASGRVSTRIILSTLCLCVLRAHEACGAPSNHRWDTGSAPNLALALAHNNRPINALIDSRAQSKTSKLPLPD